VTGVLDVGEEFGALSYEVIAPSQEVPGGSHPRWVHIGLRKHATAQEYRDLVRINFIVFAFAAVDCFHVESVSKNEGNPLAGTQIGDPVPGEHTLDGNHDVLPVGSNDAEESFGICPDILVDHGFPRAIENADIHLLRVQVDSAIVFVLLGVKSHGSSSFRWLCGFFVETSHYHRFGGGLTQYQDNPADVFQPPLILALYETKESQMSDRSNLIGVVLNIKDMVSYQPGSVVSRTLIDKSVGTVTVFAFDSGQGLSEHTAPFDALVQIIDGTADITIAGSVHTVREGEMIIMPANKPHSLKANPQFKMLLIMIRK